MAQNREQYLAAKREAMGRYRKHNPDKAREYARQWHARNRERQTAKMRDYYARRFFWGRAMKLRGPDRATFKELAAIWKRQRGRCALTGRRLDRTADLDHILPKTRGGTDRADNLRWLAREVNMVKRNLTDAEFILLCADVMQVIGERIAMVDALACD